MPPHGIGSQVPTVFPATCCGGPARFDGRIFLADLAQVEAQMLWKTTFTNVRVIVCCLQQDFGVVYPKIATATSQLWFVDCRNDVLRHPDFMRTLPAVRKCLEEGRDVLIHCRESFHRAPIVSACFIYMLTGTPYQVVHLSSTMERSLH